MMQALEPQLEKSMSYAKTTLISKEIKPLALSFLELCLSDGIVL